MKSNPQAIQSVERAFALLEAMAEAGGEAGITELAATTDLPLPDRKSTRLNSSHSQQSRMPSSA